MYFSDIIELFLGYKLICIGGFNLTKVFWISNVEDKFEALFYSDTTNFNKTNTNKYLLELCLDMN